MPDFKTIANFRRDNGAVIRAACAQFVVLCRRFNLFTRDVVVLDETSGKGTGIVGCNVQITVDAEHHLIVAHEAGVDGQQGARCNRMRGSQVLADGGCCNGDKVLACEDTGILPCIPKTQTSSGNAKRGLFAVADFICDAENDRYTYVAGWRASP